MAAPAWFVEHLEALRRLPGSRPASAKTLAAWSAQVGDAEAPSRPTVSRWLSGATLPTSFRPLELLVLGVREHTRHPTRQARETLLRVPWWREVYDRARGESGRAASPDGPRPTVVYQGMDPFGRGDADRFFGRASAIEALVGRLDALHRSGTGGPLLVLGQSGAGKTSLLAAGLLPTLERDGLPSDPAVATWPARVLTPGAHPLEALADAMSTPDGEPGSVVVVDQFEEIFQADEAVQRRFVGELVGRASSRPSPVPAAAVTGGRPGDGMDHAVDADGPAALVVIACRNDYFAELGRLARLKDALDAPFNLAPLTGDELTEAIQRPARQAGITVGNDLVGRVITDAGVDEGGLIEGQLPLISHVLRVMNQAGPMTVRAYEQVGGIEGAVAHTAAQAWEQLERAGLDRTAMTLLVRLVRVGEHSGHDTRRRLDRAELVAGEGAPGDRALEILSTARLVTVDEGTVAITHDALLRAWRRLRDTVDAERADLVMRQNVELRARQWDDAGRPPEQLLRGTVLAGAHRVTAERSTAVPLDETARAFLDAADRQEHQLATRRRRRLIAAVAAVVLILAVGTVAVIEGVAEHRVNNRVVLAEVIAQAKEARQTDSSLAAQLSLTAYRMQPDPDLYTALLETENQPLSRPLRGHTGIVRAVAQVGSAVVSGADDGTVRIWPDGSPSPATLTEPGPVTGLAAVPTRGIVVSSEAGAVPGRSALRVWNLADPHRPVALTGELPSGAARITGLATSPDGRVLVATAADGTVRLWDLADPTRPADLGVRLPGVTRSIYGSGAAVSPDGTTLAAAGDAGTVRLWTITDPAHPVALPSLPSGTSLTHAVAFSPTRKLLATGGGQATLKLWDTTDPAHATLLAQPPGTPGSSVLATAISPDGDTLAAASSDNSVTLWDIGDPTRPIPLGRPLTGHTRGVGALAFSPDGHGLVTGSADATVRVWSLPATRLATASGNVTQTQFSHDGRTLAVADGQDNTVHLWDTSDPATPVPEGPPLPEGQPGRAPAFHAAFTPDDRVLVAGAGPTVRVWTVADPRRPAPLGPDLALPAPVGSLDVSPDGHTLAVGSADGTTRLFDLTDPARPVPLGVVLPGTPDQLVGAVHFSPDGRTLATGGADHEVRLWAVADPAHAHPLAPPLTGHTDQVFEVAFSPDGTRLASVAADHTTRLWDLGDPAHPRELGRPLVRQAGAVGGVAWGADGRTLATGSDDRSVVLWDLGGPAPGAPVGDPITGHTDNVYTVAFDPGGGVLASGGRDRTVLLWHLDAEAAARRICATTPDTLTPEAWNAYVSPDRSYDPPCGAGDPAGAH